MYMEVKADQERPRPILFAVHIVFAHEAYVRPVKQTCNKSGNSQVQVQVQVHYPQVQVQVQ